MIEDKVEISLITYNRSEYLENTLMQLFKSPFKDCKITILDNCSTDKTPEVCSKYSKLFSKMNIIRHVKNIGAEANYLRAVELSNSLYTWVLCDDDDYDFSDCEDLIGAIKSENFDIILHFSWLFISEDGKTINELLENRADAKNYTKSKYNYYENLETSGEELFNLIKQYYFFIMGFIPSIIFKTKLYDSESLKEGYNNIHNSYPHYKLICNSIENNCSIYKAKNDMVIRNETMNFNHLEYFIWWVDSSIMIKKNSDREILLKKFHKGSFLQVAIYNIIRAKVCEDKNLKNTIISMISSIMKAKGIKKGIVYMILILLTSIIPKKLSKLLKLKMENIRKNMGE